MNEGVLREALRDCFDPSVPCNLVDLGCIEAIEFQLDPAAPGAGIPGVPEKYRVTIRVVPTTQDEVAGVQVSAQIVNRLAGLEQVIGTQVVLLQQPVWTPQRITGAGRRLLGLDGNPNLVQITGRFGAS